MNIVILNQTWIVITPSRLTPNVIRFDVKSTGKIYSQSKFGLIQSDSEIDSLCIGLKIITFMTGGNQFLSSPVKLLKCMCDRN